MRRAEEKSGAFAYPKHPLAKDWRFAAGVREPPQFAAIAVSRPSFAPDRRSSPALVVRPSYSSAIARAIFWEMYPSTAPMIREITTTMNGFSNEAEVTAPSLLPASASPAIAAYP